MTASEPSPTPAAEATGGYDPFAGAGGAGSAKPAPRIRLASPITGPEELAAIQSVLESGILTNGPWTRRFEEAMAARHGTAHAVAFANGTVALAAILLAAGIGPGDEVIVPSLTFIASATSVLHVGATPVFADILPDTFNLDPEDAARRITNQTKAIMPVHYGGQAADLDQFAAMAEDTGIVVIEDAAQAHGGHFQGRPSGSWGAAAMFSFTPTKNITTGEGAIVTSQDADLAQHMRLLRNHGMSAPYQHDILGYNWRLTEMQSAMGCVQLDRLDDILATKAANADHMEALLAGHPGVTPPARPADRDHPFMLYTVLVAAERRDAGMAALDAAGIESRIYFPPAHHQPVFADLPDPKLPVTEEIVARMISLPFHARLTDADREEIVAVLTAAVEDT